MRPRERRRDRSRRSDRSRAQSETLGFVLLFSLVLVAAGTIVSFGVIAVDNSEERLSADRAEKVMTQMDSEISMVALGRTDSQWMRFDRVSGEQFKVDAAAGRINITRIGDNGTSVIMDDVTLGEVKFERGNTVVAYQGGGVWRSDGAGGSMVSPPEFNYRDRTLTLPLVTVSGDYSLSRGATIEKAGPSTRYFPNETAGQTNPLEDDVVQVTIETEYHRGWKNYFESRTEGDVIYKPEEQLVSVNLTAPAVETFENGVAATNINEKGNAEFEKKTTLESTAASASGRVDERINECKSNCTDVGTSLNGTKSAGRYYTDDDLSVDTGTVFDTEDGDIEVIVDGELTFDGSGGPGDLDQEITGGGQVRFYVKGNVTISGNAAVNTGGDPDDLLMLVHSDADTVKDSGTIQFTGFIYAPNSDFSIKGGGACGNNGNGNGNGGNNKCLNNVYGGVVADTAEATGGGYLKHGGSASIRLEFETSSDVLTFLHISTNPVTVSG